MGRAIIFISVSVILSIYLVQNYTIRIPNANYLN